MQVKYIYKSKIIAQIAGFIIVGLVILISLAYFAISYQYMAGGLEVEAENNARIITQIISLNPEYWEFEQVRLKEELSHRPRSGEKEIRRVINNKNQVVAESADDVKFPVKTTSTVVRDAGFVVGKIEISRSLMPLLMHSGLLLLLMLLIGFGLFLVLYLYPIQAIHREEKLRKQAEEEKDKAFTELKEAHANVNILSGMLPICASCKKIRDDKGYWEDVASYITKHSEAVFTHGLCPVCAEKAMKEIEEFKKSAT